MRTLCRLYNRCLVRPFLVNSLPKSGTHLLTKILTLFPGIQLNEQPISHVGPTNILQFQKPEDSTTETVTLNTTWPRPAPRAVVRRTLQQVRRGQFRHTHAPYSPELASLFAELKMRTVLILRDLRDVVVSAADWYPRITTNIFHPIYLPLSEADRIMVSIRGWQPTKPGEPRVGSIDETCRSLLPWLNHPNNYTTFFHRLVGPQGGGTAGDQMTELKNISRHLGLGCTAKELATAARKCYGGTRTFRTGTSGGWRKHFTEEHKRAFKEVAGRLLIELGFEKDLDW